MNDIPDPNQIFPNEYKTSVFLKNVITAPNIIVGDYTYYDASVGVCASRASDQLNNFPPMQTARSDV